MHLSSLPSRYGIGTMGREARAFVDFLAEAGQSVWQLLPICPTSYGDSPYQSFSTFAGNPYFIDLDLLAGDGLLEPEDYQNLNWGSSQTEVDYGLLYETRYPVLHRAVENFLKKNQPEFERFCAEQGWLGDYALFMALKDSNGGAPWWDWAEPLRNRDPEAIRQAEEQHRDGITFWKVLQFLFYRQWDGLKQYAHEKKMSIMGDMPIYVSLDSVDVWAHPELFQLDGNKIPCEVAGCPPDGFSADGQLWGNPLFDWDYMEATGYRWWVDRIGYLCRVYDQLRIDHFRGFDAYYAIPYGDKTARNGRWRPGPGMKLFRAVDKALGPQNIIAEDLGFLTDSVRQLLQDSGYPGMKVMELGFDSRDPGSSDYLPHSFPVRCVAYVGTHDNDTAEGWMQAADPEDAALARKYLGLNPSEGYSWGMMRGLWASAAELTVVQAQDLLGLGLACRMNTPSTVGLNWKWRAAPGAFTHQLAAKLRERMGMYDRLNQ